MTTKKYILGVSSIVITVATACGGWANSISSSVAAHNESIIAIEKNLQTINKSMGLLYKRYEGFDFKLSDLIHKQDKRISLLEYIVVEEQKKNERQ